MLRDDPAVKAAAIVAAKAALTAWRDEQVDYNDALLTRLLSDDGILSAAEYDLAMEKPYARVINAHRNALVSQHKVDGKKYLTAACQVIIHVGNPKQTYVLFVDNRAQAERQITSTSVRVDEADVEKTGSIENACMLALDNRLKDMGVDVDSFDAKKFKIDRDKAGLKEDSDTHQTNHYFYEIQVKDETEFKVIKAKMDDARRKADAGPQTKRALLLDAKDVLGLQREGAEQVNLDRSGGEVEVITLSLFRPNTIFYARAILSCVKSPNLSSSSTPTSNFIEPFANDLFPHWLVRRGRLSMPQYSLFHPNHNTRTYSELKEMALAIGYGSKDSDLNNYIENIGNHSLKPERILFQEVMCQILYNVAFNDLGDIEKNIGDKIDKFTGEITEHERSSLADAIEIKKNKYAKTAGINDEMWKSVGITRARAIESFMIYSQPTSVHYVSQSYESFASVEKILLDDYIAQKATHEIYREFAATKMTELTKSSPDIFPPIIQVDAPQAGVISGPVASGKSSGGKVFAEGLHGELPVVISPDALMNVVLADQKVELIRYSHLKGKLNLTETYFIKQILFNLMRNNNLLNKPHILLEAMNPFDYSLITSLKGKGYSLNLFTVTANPAEVLNRMVKRGEKEDRYIQPVNTIASYNNFSSVIYMMSQMNIMLHGNGADKPGDINAFKQAKFTLIDSNANYGPELKNPKPRGGSKKELDYVDKKNEILTIDFMKKEIIIHNLPRLVTFILRSIELKSRDQLGSSLADINKKGKAMFASMIHEEKSKLLAEKMRELFKLDYKIQLDVPGAKDTININKVETMVNRALKYYDVADKAASQAGIKFFAEKADPVAAKAARKETFKKNLEQARRKYRK